MTPTALVIDGDAMVRWAESHRAEVRVESDTLGGRKLRKITLEVARASQRRVPSPAARPSGSSPIRSGPSSSRVEYDDGRSLEMQTDYPAPESVPDDLFAFRPPADVTIEINDPDLGRQVYSDPHSGAKP